MLNLSRYLEYQYTASFLTYSFKQNFFKTVSKIKKKIDTRTMFLFLVKTKRCGSTSKNLTLYEYFIKNSPVSEKLHQKQGFVGCLKRKRWVIIFRS